MNADELKAVDIPAIHTCLGYNHKINKPKTKTRQV